jgi:hypothetical protein
MTDPYGTSGRGDDDPTPTDPPDREPEIVEGEVVDDATADAFGGRRSGTGGFIGQSPFAEPDPFGVPGSAPQFGVGGVGASFAALRSLAGNSPELREMVTTPLRLLAIVVAVPALIAALFGLTIDSGARYLAFVIGALGLVAAVLLELRRRRLVGRGHLRGRPGAVGATGRLGERRVHRHREGSCRRGRRYRRRRRFGRGGCCARHRRRR